MTEIEIDPGIRQAVTRSISKTENIRGIFDAKGRPVIRKSDVFHKRSDYCSSKALAPNKPRNAIFGSSSAGGVGEKYPVTQAGAQEHTLGMGRLFDMLD